MAAYENLKLLKAMLYSRMGSPLLPTILEVDPDADIAPAIIKYYTHLPLIKIGNYNMFKDREQVINYLTSATSNPDLNDSKYFYVGIVHYATRNQLGQTRFDEYLLGVSVTRPNFNVESQLLNMTVGSMNTGDIYVEEDPVHDQARFVVGGSCILSVLWGWGYQDLAKVPTKHLELLVWLVGIRYYARLLSVYKTGTFKDADFDINADLVADSLKECQEKSEERLRAIELMPATMG